MSNKNQQQQQQQPQQQQQSNSQSQENNKVATPLIYQRVSKIPAFNKALTMGLTHYDKLKTSNVTVGDVMTRAETWVVFLWQKVSPYVGKADKLACTTLDYLEGYIQTDASKNKQTR